MDYQQRLLNFLVKNPKLKLTTKQIAQVWKRSEHDVWCAAQTLYQQGKISVTSKGQLRVV